MKQRDKVIFLDIDGVLALPCTRYDYFHAPCFERLHRLVTETDSWIVISSAWRIGSSIENLQDIFRNSGDQTFVIHGIKIYTGEQLPFCAERVIGKTLSSHKTEEEGIPFGRGEDIRRWLEKHSGEIGLKNFVIIDDESYDLGTYVENTVKVDGFCGLQDEDIKKAKEILMRP